MQAVLEMEVSSRQTTTAGEYPPIDSSQGRRESDLGGRASGGGAVGGGHRGGFWRHGQMHRNHRQGHLPGSDAFGKRSGNELGRPVRTGSLYPSGLAPAKSTRTQTA